MCVSVINSSSYTIVILREPPERETHSRGGPETSLSGRSSDEARGIMGFVINASPSYDGQTIPSERLHHSEQRKLYIPPPPQPPERHTIRFEEEYLPTRDNSCYLEGDGITLRGAVSHLYRGSAAVGDKSRSGGGHLEPAPSDTCGLWRRRAAQLSYFLQECPIDFL